MDCIRHKLILRDAVSAVGLKPQNAVPHSPATSHSPTTHTRRLAGLELVVLSHLGPPRVHSSCPVFVVHSLSYRRFSWPSLAAAQLRLQHG